MAAQEGSEGGSPTPHGEAARRVQAFVRAREKYPPEAQSGAVHVIFGPTSDTVTVTGADIRTLLEEHGEMAAMLEDSLSGLEYIARRYGPLDGVGWDRINAYRAKLDGSPEPEAEPKPLYYSKVIAARRKSGRPEELDPCAVDPGFAFCDSPSCGIHAILETPSRAGKKCCVKGCSGTYRVPVPDPEPEPAKPPAAPKVEVGQVWRDVSLWFVADVRSDRVRLRSTCGPDCWRMIDKFLAEFTLVSSPTGEGI